MVVKNLLLALWKSLVTFDPRETESKFYDEDSILNLMDSQKEV